MFELIMKRVGATVALAVATGLAIGLALAGSGSDRYESGRPPTRQHAQTHRPGTRPDARPRHGRGRKRLARTRGAETRRIGTIAPREGGDESCNVRSEEDVCDYDCEDEEIRPGAGAASAEPDITPVSAGSASPPPDIGPLAPSTPSPPPDIGASD